MMYIADHQMVQEKKGERVKKRTWFKINRFKMLLISPSMYIGVVYSIFIYLKILPDKRLKETKHILMPTIFKFKKITQPTLCIHLKKENVTNVVENHIEQPESIEYVIWGKLIKHRFHRNR